ncbi:Twitchin [Araneus ventricosus]|uniref:Twitchin n=1 Tax=Araneus ventricosus TaxID=182803 RepID=A0A4Y2RRU8_ARAVE|nr:Twitchin [Araneus ventricosus]GBN78555.1 Twitchin [Araneus ventricosus]
MNDAKIVQEALQGRLLDLELPNLVDKPSAPGVPVVTEVGGDFVNLSWEKPESDGGSRIQGYWVEKREVGTLAWQRVGPNLSITTQVNISNLIEDRQYEFRVFAVNEAGMSPPSSNSTSVKIKDPNAPVPPEFVIPLRNVMAVENKSAQFTCKVTGNPKPTIIWYKGTRELMDGGKFTMLKDGDTYSLVVSEAYGEDADEYACRATNKGGSRTSRAELLIKTAPLLHVPPRFRELACFEKGENVTLKIPFTGLPKPKIKWSKDGDEIETGMRYDVSVGERHAILTIRDVQKWDNGPYRIVAENELGVDSAIIKVQINDKPDPPRFPVVETICDDFVTLSWKPPLWDGGSHVSSYLIEKQECPMTSWIRCGNTRFTYHTINGLNPGKDYVFRIYAENVYGRSDPSEPTQLVTTKLKEKDAARRKHYMLDAQGKRIRGKSEGKVKNYDQFVFDVFDKYIPQPVDIKTSSVYDKYDILEEIGTGAFGVVHRCRERKTGNIFAAKFIPVAHPLEKSLIRKEIDVMNHLHHPKLVHLHDAFEDDDEMVLIYEFMSGGELFEKITDDSYFMCEAEVINYMRQICEGMKHMHEKNIIHLDIKPENIMCQTKASNNIKLIDFGLATKLDPNEVVKISTGTAEFAAPEIVNREPVGFYTDMWAVGVLAYVLLSGLSPFAGDNDVETLKNVRACDWEFDDEAFANISNEGKDFISKLLTRSKDKRMTAHECLEHPWLKGDLSHDTRIRIPNRRYVKFRDDLRDKYADSWKNCLLPFGHIANYSSLRKLHQEKYKIHDFYFDRLQAAPRFVIRPQSTFCYEGQSAKFFCRVTAPAPPTVSWYRDNSELRQSVKYMKRYEGHDYYFVINRCKLDDRGEYIIRAENHYGSREEPVFLNVQSVPIDIPKIVLDEPVRRRQELQPILPPEPKDCPPLFTFLLRPRIIQVGIGVKLLCCLEGKPVPEIRWFKDGREVGKHMYSTSFNDGVVALEIPSCTLDDAGTFVCTATNELGEDRTSCTVKVEDRRGPSRVQSPAVTPRVATPTFYRDTMKSPFITPYGSVKTSAPRPQPKVADPVSSTLSAAASRLSAPDAAKRAQKPYGKKEKGDGTTGLARSRTATKELQIPEDKPMTPPKFIQSLGDRTVQDGEQVTLKCTVSGDPEPQVEWTKNGKILHSSKEISLKYKQGIATLTIEEVYPEDAGEYICKATNSMGTVSTKCKLQVSGTYSQNYGYKQPLFP